MRIQQHLARTYLDDWQYQPLANLIMQCEDCPPACVKFIMSCLHYERLELLRPAYVAMIVESTIWDVHNPYYEIAQELANRAYGTFSTYRSCYVDRIIPVTGVERELSDALWDGFGEEETREQHFHKVYEKNYDNMTQNQRDFAVELLDMWRISR
jgi:hypothetical protein